MLVVARSMHVGGTEQYLLRTLPLLRERGIDVEVFLIDRAGQLLPLLEATGIAVHGKSVASFGLARRAWTTAASIGAVRSLVRTGRYDIVHSYLFWSDVIGCVGARLGGAKRVIESRRAMSAWRRPRGPAFVALETLANAAAHELIANSQAVLREAERQEIALPRCRIVIYNGVDLPSEVTARPGAEMALRLLCVGALAPRKGQLVLLSALTQLGGLGEVHLDLVGSGDDENSLRQFVRDHGLEPIVTFHGERLDVEPYYRGADLFVLPSRQEGFSNALLEAMARGLPVIATDVGGNREALPPEGGIIVPAEDPAAFAAAIRALAARRAELPAMGLRNRQAVEERFTLAASVRATADWYLRAT